MSVPSPKLLINSGIKLQACSSSFLLIEGCVKTNNTEALVLFYNVQLILQFIIETTYWKHSKIINYKSINIRDVTIAFLGPKMSYRYEDRYM